MNRLFEQHMLRNMKSLSGAWKFKADKDNAGEKEGWNVSLTNAESVTVPSVWNTDIGMLNYEGACWYEKKFYTEGGTLLFEFESVMTKADIWLDGERIGDHYGAFSQFEIIVNDVKKGEHILTVRADSAQDKQSLPQPRSDFFNYGGIARDVYVHVLKGGCVLTNHIEYTLSDDLKNASVCASMEIYNAENKDVTSQLSVCVGDTEIYSEKVTLKPYEKRNIRSTPVLMENISLWSTECPNLYTVSAHTDTDDLIDRIGFRKIEVKDGEILLNGQAIELRGVNRHEEDSDWGFAFPSRLMKRDLDIICELGCNTVRGSHYPQSRIFVDMLDERGILFWSEIPMWGGSLPDTILTDPVVEKRALEMHREMTKYYYNHPSIIIWGMHNEVWTPYPCVYGITKQMNAHLRAEGGNRLITHATLCPNEDTCYEFDDIICINHYKGWYGGGNGGFLDDWKDMIDSFRSHREKIGMSDKPVIISEFGAGALYGYHSAFDDVKWSEEYQAKLLNHCIELFHNDPMIKGFYVWQFANTRTYTNMELNRARGFNNKGLVDEYRRPKSAYFKVKELYHKYNSEK